jgi:DNA-binding response OmpR family regulator
MDKPESPTSVVIVDDDPALTDLLVQYINVLGFRAIAVPPVSSEQVAFSIVAQTPDVVLLDIDLGETSGLDVARDLRQQGYDGTVVAMTGLVFTESPGKGRLVSFNALWSKPIDPDVIKAFLSALSRSNPR